MTLLESPASTEPASRSGLIALMREMGLSGPVLVGFAIIAVFFGGFMGWATLAPLGSAAIAQGTVSVETNRKTVQHLEGGIIGEIKVQDGSRVEAGQVLLTLDETQARAALEIVRGRQMAAEGLNARLLAERNGSPEIAFPDLLQTLRKDPNVGEIINGQISIFNARRDSLKGNFNILKQQIAQLAEEIKGLQGQIKSEKIQLQLIAGEISDISELVEKGLIPRPRLSRLQRDAAEIDGNLSQNRSRIAQAKQTIAETQLRISELKTERINEVVQELREVQSGLFDLAERERATADVLQRTVIRAPMGGTVVNLQVHTPGGVIPPGASLLDIVPSGDRLIVEARVDPSDIDVVHIGLPAQARFTAFSQRRTQPVNGTVTAVSADSLTDDRTGETYYLARIEIDDDLAGKLGGAELYPGMQAEVMIVTGEQTALEYFLKPLTSSLNRAFRED